MWLTGIAIRRPVFVLMVVAALIVMGLNSASKMRLELNPNVDIPYVAISTVYAGAGPEEIESQVTKKVEDGVASVNGVKSITSSSQEGQSTVTVEFNLGVKPEVAAADVREKISSIRGSLPTEAEDPVVMKFDMSSQPVLYYGLTGKRPSREIRDLADNVIKPRLSQIGGVAAVTVTGGDVREIAIAVHKDRLEAYGIGIQQLVALLQGNNLNYPAGHVIEGNREYSVRVVGQFTDVSSIGLTRIHAANGQTFRLSDIADVRDSSEERRTLSRIDRSDSVALVVQKTSEGNTVEVCRGIRAAVARLQKELPKDIKFTVNSDQSTRVEDSVNDVKSSLFLGAFLAVLVVFVFLHNLRGTFIVGIAIPTSVMATFLPMFAFGFTLNTMTMLALSLAVGILVDDSIVVLENIYRHLSKGEEPVEASYNGRGEIGLAAITITLVDVVVFVPIAFMGGIVGQFFKSFGLTVASATLFSLFMSFTLTPMLASRWYRSGESVEEGTKTGIFGVIERFLHWLDRLYRKALAWAIRYRGVVVYVGNSLLLVVLVAIVSSFSAKEGMAGALRGAMPIVVFLIVLGVLMLWRYRVVGLITLGAVMAGVFLAVSIGVGAGKPLFLFRFAPNQDNGQISVAGELPAGTALAKTTQVTKRVEDAVAQVKDVQGIFTAIGASSAGMLGSGSTGTQYFTMSLKLRDKMSLSDSVNPFADTANLRKRADTAVVEEVRKRIGSVPGATIKVNAVSGFGGGGSAMQVDIQGSNIDDLNRIAQQVLQVFRNEEGIVNPDVSSRIGKPEQRIEIDRDKAASYGLSIATIASTLRTSLEGSEDGAIVYRENGNEYTIRVRFADLDRRNVEDIKSVVVGNMTAANGAVLPVRLADVAAARLSNGPTKIDRLDREKKVSVTADIKPGYAPGNLQLDIDKKLQAINFGTNSYRWGGENKMQADESGYMFSAMALAIILVYMLMAALFDNVLYPLVIMLALPQALIGALLALMLTGNALSIVAMIGFIMLVGLVTKNAILLVDYTNTLRGRGLSRTDAILEAGPTRLRPILMTTFAMIGGMAPTALALGRGGEFRAPLAIAVVGGLILSTMLTLLVVPCIYTYFDDLSRLISRVIFRRKLEPEPDTASPREPATV